MEGKQRRPSSILPDSLPPVGVSREQAAAFIGISAATFDRLVAAGIMPDGRVIFGRIVWDVAEVASAFRQIPHRSEPIARGVDEIAPARNPWDHDA